MESEKWNAKLQKTLKIVPVVMMDAQGGDFVVNVLFIIAAKKKFPAVFLLLKLKKHGTDLLIIL